MNRRAPRVTVGVPTYNRASYLRNAITQILSQDFRDFELVICDDASTDATPEVANGFSDERLIYSRNDINLKIPGNLNRILSQARGEYIVFLHDHDSFHPSLLSRMVRVLDENNSIGLVFSGLGWTDHLGGGYRELIEDLPEKVKAPSLVRTMLESPDFSCPINACGMVRRSIYEAAGYRFDERFGFISDVDMWFRIGLQFDIGYIPEPLIVCRSREPGHEFGSLNWRLVRWTIEIQRTNLARYCNLVPESRERLAKNLRTKVNALLASSMLRAVASGQRSNWDEGIGCLQEYGTSLIRGMARLLALIPAAVVLFLLAAAKYFNNWRQLRRSSIRADEPA